MKFSFFAVLLASLIGAQAQAQGGLSSGGISPPAPRAVVIQERIREGDDSNRALARIVRALAKKDLESGKAVAFTHAEDEVVNGHWRLRWCVEYEDFDLFLEATDLFKEKLSQFESAAVLSNGFCR